MGLEQSRVPDVAFTLDPVIDADRDGWGDDSVALLSGTRGNPS